MASFTGTASLPARRKSRAAQVLRQTPLVSVVIVNYRRWQETAALLDQLLGEDHLYRDRIEVLVIDNASPLDRLAARVQIRTDIRVHRLAQNRGFSAGVNAGMRMSRGRWLLVLNPDLKVPAGFLDLVCAAALDLDGDLQDGRPVGIAGFQLCNRDGTHQFSTGFFPTLWKMLGGLLRPRHRRKYQTIDIAERRSVPWVTGSCFLVRRSCLRQLGGFDEDFFLYYEDVDVCRRAQAKGWAVCYEPAVQAVHLDPLQNRRPTTLLWAITRHSALTYFAKHLPGWQFWALAQIVRAEAWLRQRRFNWLGRQEDAAICHELRGLCRDLMRGRPAAARRRLDGLLKRPVTATSSGRRARSNLETRSISRTPGGAEMRARRQH